MDQTSSASGNASVPGGGDVASLLTSVHLIWLAVFAALIVVGILYGARLKRRREKAEREVAGHAAEAGVERPPARADEPAADPPLPPERAPDAPAAPASVPATGEAAPADGPVGQLKGLGPKVAARLAELGIATVGQIAALDDDAARRLDAQLGPFRGRMERDRWIEQARFLAAGDRAGFEAVFGKL